MHLMPEEPFYKLKRRWAGVLNRVTSESLKDGTSGVLDPKISEVVFLINLIPELVTIFSCSGHLDRVQSKHDEAYIIIGTIDEKVVYSLYDRFVKKLSDVHKVDARISIGYRGDITRPDLRDEFGVYPTWVLSFRYFEGNEELFMLALKEAASELLNDRRVKNSYPNKK